MSVLPPPRWCPDFQIDGNGFVPRNISDFPCEIFNYVADSGKWMNDIADPSQRTVNGILGNWNGQWDHVCFYCEQDQTRCPRHPCLAAWLTSRQRYEQKEKFAIRQTTNNTGLGIFATTQIYQGEILDEYFGELIPPALAEARPDDSYKFQIRNIAYSTARDYGNWTRFLNHSCQRFNVEAVDDVIGGRRTITFRALRRIRRNQELLMDYGPGYFSEAPDGVLCNCDARPEPHIPPDYEDRAPDNEEAVPGRPEPRQSAPLQGDIAVAARNAWITENKNDLALTEPNGPRRWTMLHWRCMEQLIRWRKKKDVWQSKTAHLNLTSSRGDPMLGKYIKTLRAQMKIFQWHLDVVKAFQQDKVVGMRQGKPWETTDLLKRVFGLNVAARRRRRLSGRRSRSVTPVEGPRTPEPKGTAPGLPTPPSTGGNLPTLPSDLMPPPVPSAATRARQAMRANARRRRRERRTHSP